MPDEGYMHAAAAAVPDAGDGALRERLADAIRGRLFRGGYDEKSPSITSVTIGRDTSYPDSLADAVAPLIREHVAAAVQAERERVATVIGMADEAGGRILDERNEALAAIERVRNMHRPCRIFDECDHKHELTASGGLPDGVVEVEEVGLTCEDGFLYRICYECCTGGSNFQSEECVDHHTHSPDGVYCSTIHVLDDELEVLADA